MSILETYICRLNVCTNINVKKNAGLKLWAHHGSHRHIAAGHHGIELGKNRSKSFGIYCTHKRHTAVTTTCFISFIGSFVKGLSPDLSQVV